MPAGVSRRDFLKSSGRSATAIALPYFVPATVLGRDNSVAASETIRIGVIGTGNRARQLMDQLSAVGRIVAIADCYQARLEQTLAEKKQSWATYGDYRRMFDQEQLDAVIVATPDHGRSLPCIRACQRGLDVYAEKPLTAYVAEGRTSRRCGPQARLRIPGRYTATHDGNQSLLLRSRAYRSDRRTRIRPGRELHRSQPIRGPCCRTDPGRRRLGPVVRSNGIATLPSKTSVSVDAMAGVFGW